MSGEPRAFASFRRRRDARGRGSARRNDTAITTQFNEGWPDAPHRVLRSALTKAQDLDYHRVSPPSREAATPVTHMALYAGTGVGEVRTVRPAAEIVAELVRLLSAD